MQYLNIRVVGSVYVGKSDRFQHGFSEDREISKPLLTNGESAIVIEVVNAGKQTHKLFNA